MIEISVIIPTYNRSARLRRCLEALSLQTVEHARFEVIVVLDGSTDDSQAMLAEGDWPFQLTTLWQENQGQNNARNFGVTVATGRFCLFIDDDIIVDPQCVFAHLKHLHDQSDAVTIGQIRLKLQKPTDQFTYFYAQGWQNHYHQLNEGRPPTWQDCYGGNIAMAKALFEKVGGFAPDIRRSHDIELGVRLQQSGAPLIYLSEAASSQEEHKSSAQIMRDAERNGSGWVLLCERHPSVTAELLGYFSNVDRRERLIRRILLSLHLPGSWLQPIGRLFSSPKRQKKWQRFLLSYSYWLGVKKAVTDTDHWRRITHGTRILMYHGFCARSHEASRYVLSKRHFRLQMAWLKWRNYNVMSLRAFISYLMRGELPPNRSIVITIDDAFQDVAAYASPILTAYNFPATLFVVSQRTGKQCDWSQEPALADRPILTIQQIKELGNNLLEVGAHTQTHPRLADIPTESAEKEILGCKTELQSHFGQPIDQFAYPFGQYSEEINDIVAQSGFAAACTVDDGYNTLTTPLLKLHRQEVNGDQSFLKFLWKLW